MGLAILNLQGTHLPRCVVVCASAMLSSKG